MTKQEEIREEAQNVIEEEICAGGSGEMWIPDCGMESLFRKLSDLGVVIKATGFVLPFVTSSFTLSEHGVYVKVSKEALGEQGYEAVEPLIEEA